MRKNNTYNRIQKIYDVLGRGGFFSTNEISEITGEPKGTVSPLLSALTATKNIYNDRGNGYKCEYFHKDLKKVAQDVANYEKNRREMIKAKRIVKAQRLQKIVDAVANGMSTQLTIDTEKNFQTELNEYAAETSAAIEMLKSRGYKVLAPVTEFKEI